MSRNFSRRAFTRRARLPVAAIVAVSTVLLAGCAGQQSTSVPVPGPTLSDHSTDSTNSPTPAPEPTSTSAVANPDDPRSWLIGFTGIGPLALGQPITEGATAMTAFTNAGQDACPWVTAFDKSGFPSIWIPDPSGAGVVEQIVLQAWGSPGTVVAANSPRTSSGIGIGATLGELKTAYPELSKKEGKYAPHYSLPDDGGSWINFGVNNQGVVDSIVVRTSSEIDSEYCG